MLNLIGKRSGDPRSRDVPHGRPKAARRLAGLATVLLISTAGACSPSTPRTAPSAESPSGSGPASTPTPTPGAVAIPTGNLDAYTQCLVDAGWQITAVHAVPGEPPGYEMIVPSNLDSQEVVDRSAQCDTLKPSPRMPTEADIRVIYDRWVKEYQCLVGLKYQPDPPPSFETFLATYGTGPWSPIKGTGWESWTQSQYDAASAKCTLEMLLR